MRRLLIGVVLLAALAVGLIWLGRWNIGPVVITAEDELKIILLLDDPELPGSSIRTEAGLWFRVPIPVISRVITFDKRHQYLNSEPLQIQTRDSERPMIDHYVIWHIADPLRFLESFPNGMQEAARRVDAVVRAEVRKVIGQSTLEEVVTTSRIEIMRQIAELSDESLRDTGVAVADVRINRTELPRTTETNVFARMTTERQRLARKYRAEGDEEGRRIRAEADREARVLVVEATREAEILRGEGDAESARIYAEAHSQAAEFYGFVRRLEAYRKTIGEQTTLVLPPDNEFFELLSRYREGVSASPGPRR